MIDIVTRLRAFAKDADSAAKQVGYGMPDLVLVAFQENAKLFTEAAETILAQERRFNEHHEAWKANNVWHAARITELEQQLAECKNNLECHERDNW
jgi:hypothetical protein